jgi:hypothetical protein
LANVSALIQPSALNETLRTNALGSVMSVFVTAPVVPTVYAKVYLLVPSASVCVLTR